MLPLKLLIGIFLLISLVNFVMCVDNKQNQDQFSWRQLPFSTDQRPLYNIGHMCNSIKKTLDYLSRGANAIEVDVTFKADDIYLYHGYPCDCFRFCWDKESLANYLTFVRKSTLPGLINYRQHFVILYFDLKLKNLSDDEKRENGIRFANYLVAHFFNEFPVRNTIKLIVAISYGDDSEFLTGFIERLKEMEVYDDVKNFIGYDIGIEKDVERARQIWTDLNVTNVWQGEGITNCFNPIIGNNLEKLVRMRDSNNAYFAKVYRWTMDLTDSIRSVLQYNIDGIMTNHPERVVKILRDDPDFSSAYRLATIHDNPFVRYSPIRRSSIPFRQNAGKVSTFIRDMQDSFRKYVREIFRSIF